MNTRPWSFGLAAAIALTVLVWMLSLAVAGDKLTVTVTFPAPSGTDVEFIDGSGKPGSCPFVKLGIFSCNTSGASTPYLLLNSGPMFGYALSLKGTANINGLTDFGVNQIYQAWSTTPEAQWASPTPPLQTTQPMLNSANAMMDRTFELPLTELRIKPTLTYDFFKTKYNSPAAWAKCCRCSSTPEFGATEGVQATLPGWITYSATAEAITSTMGTISRWTVDSGAGATTYQSEYAMYPGNPDAPGLFTGINKFLGRYLKTCITRDRCSTP